MRLNPATRGYSQLVAQRNNGYRPLGLRLDKDMVAITCWMGFIAEKKNSV